MNKNIEVINDHLWAVKFLYIPYIEEINYQPDPCTSAYDEFGRVTNEGLLILNKDFKGYNTIKAMFIKMMNKSDVQLKFEKEQSIEKKTNYQIIYAAALLCELERRTKERGK
ncbi:MAG: hypothetical protein WCG21_10810 [Eubacteriales bacterium]